MTHGEANIKYVITYKIPWSSLPPVNLNRDMDEYVYSFLNLSR